MLTLINPFKRAEPFDHPDWVFEAKFDGFRAAADTVRGRLISRNGNRMQRFERVLDLLPKGHVFDGDSPSVSPTPIIRSSRGGTRSSTRATRSVSAAPNGFSTEGAVSDGGRSTPASPQRADVPSDDHVRHSRAITGHRNPQKAN
jgi:hypothetical protein